MEIIINSVTMNFEIHDDKLGFILEEASYLLKTRVFPIKRLASWVGKLKSLRLAIGSIVSIMCKTIYNVLKLAQTWFSSASLDVALKMEVTWWLHNLKYFSSFPIIIDAKVSSATSGQDTLLFIWICKLN